VEVAQSDYNLFTVESILRHRWTDGKHRTKKWLQFLVKWQGYDIVEATWEPWENMAKVAITQDYLRATPGLGKFANNNLVNDPMDL
jgi:hypothetical protein